MTKVKYTRSCFNYTGSKYRLLDKIIPLFPKEFKFFFDPFCGGMSVSLNTKAEVIFCNDLDINLISFYNMVKSLPKEYLINYFEKYIKKYNLYGEFLEDINKIAITRETYANIKAEFNSTKQALLLPLLSGVSFSNTIRYNSNGIYNVSYGKRALTNNWRTRMENFIDKIKAKNYVFDFGDYRNSIKYISSFDPSEVFIYLDPPYSITDATYNQYWDNQADNNLFSWIDYLHENGYKFLLSNLQENKNKKNENLMEWAKKYEIINLKVNYKNSIVGKKNENYTISKEVLIKNY